MYNTISDIRQLVEGSGSMSPAIVNLHATLDLEVPLEQIWPLVSDTDRVNRLIGVRWLAKILYPSLFSDDLRALTRDFCARFYHVTPSEAQIDRVLAGRD